MPVDFELLEIDRLIACLLIPNALYPVVAMYNAPALVTTGVSRQNNDEACLPGYATNLAYVWVLLVPQKYAASSGVEWTLNWTS